MNRDEARKLVAEIKENFARLHNCKSHKFIVRMSPAEIQVALNGRAVCENCGGKMKFTDISEYVRGYIAAGGDANDVWPGWYDEHPDE